jgi:hypothetical protein
MKFLLALVRDVESNDQVHAVQTLTTRKAALTQLTEGEGEGEGEGTGDDDTEVLSVDAAKEAVEAAEEALEEAQAAEATA